MTRRQSAIILLLAVAILIRCVFFFGGVRGSDAYAYAYEAYNIATGQYDVQADTAYYGFRYAVLLPTALSYALFGVSDWSSALFPLLASLGTLLVVVQLGTRLFDERTGWLAGWLYAFFPLDLPNATLLGPSSFIPLLSTVALYVCWIAGEERTTEGRARWLFLLAGLCVGLAMQARESSVLLLGSIGAILIYRQAWSWNAVLVLIGFAIPLVAESSYYWMQTGDPLYRMTVIQQLNDLYAADVARGSQDHFIGGPTSWTYYPSAMFGWDLGGFAWFGFFVYLAIGAVVLAWWKGKVAPLLPLLVWMALPLLYLEFGSVSLLRYVPLPKGYHYMSLVSVPLLLVGASGLALCFRLARENRLHLGMAIPSRWQTGGIVLTMAGLAATSCYGSYRVLENIHDDARPFEQVASVVRAHPERPIYVPHFRWVLFLNYFLGYQTGTNYYSRHPNYRDGRLRYLSQLKTREEIPSAYIVLHDRYLHYDTVGLPVDRKTVVSEGLYASLASLRVVTAQQGHPAYNSFTVVEMDRGSESSSTYRGAGAESRRQ